MDDYARQLASNKETGGNRQQSEQGQLTYQDRRYLPMRKADDTEGSQIAAAFRQGNARTVVDHAESHNDSEAKVNGLYRAHHFTRGSVEAGTRISGDRKSANTGRFLGLGEEIIPLCPIDCKMSTADSATFAHEAA